MREAIILQRLDHIEMELREIKGLLLGQKNMIREVEEPNGQEEMISAKEVARLLQCDLQVVYTKCAHRELPHVKMGKSYKFKKSEILNWIKQQQAASSFSVEGYVDRYLQKHSRKG